MQINELTPSDLKTGLTKKKYKSPFPGQTKYNPNEEGLWDNFKVWSDFLKKRGWKKLGNGSFSAVYGKPGLTYVIKIPFKRDRPWMEFADFCIAHKNNPHLMKIAFVKEETSNHFFIAAAERLKPIPERVAYEVADVIKQARSHTQKELTEYVTTMYAPTATKTWILKNVLPQTKALAKICDELAAIRHLDLHEGNIMMRGKTIVIIDPWFDWNEQKSGSAVSLYS